MTPEFAHAPLLLQSDGSPWGDNPGASYHREGKKIVTDVGADPKATMYALRHSSIARALMRGLPVAIVSRWHDTSPPIIEAHYGRFIKHHYDELVRAALLDTSPAAPADVVPLRRA